MIKPPQLIVATEKSPFSGEPRDRISSDKTAIFISALLHEDHPAHLKVTLNLGIQGPLHRQWVEVQAWNSKGQYTLIFGIRERAVSQLWVIFTPKGSCYDIDIDGGNPLGDLGVEDLRKLTELLVPKDNVITLRPLWRLEIDGRPVYPSYNKGITRQGRATFPKELDQGPIMDDYETAKSALEKFTEYHRLLMLDPPPEEKKPKKKAGLKVNA